MSWRRFFLEFPLSYPKLEPIRSVAPPFIAKQSYPRLGVDLNERVESPCASNEGISADTFARHHSP